MILEWVHISGLKQIRVKYLFFLLGKNLPLQFRTKLLILAASGSTGRCSGTGKLDSAIYKRRPAIYTILGKGPNTGISMYVWSAKCIMLATIMPIIKSDCRKVQKRDWYWYKNLSLWQSQCSFYRICFLYYPVTAKVFFPSVLRENSSFGNILINVFEQSFTSHSCWKWPSLECLGRPEMSIYEEGSCSVLLMAVLYFSWTGLGS